MINMDAYNQIWPTLQMNGMSHDIFLKWKEQYEREHPFDEPSLQKMYEDALAYSDNSNNSDIFGRNLSNPNSIYKIGGGIERTGSALESFNRTGVGILF